MQGLENIPAKFEKIVIVCNHQSSLDMAVLSYLWYLPFYVVYKRELLFYPGIGTAMALANYYSVDRKVKESGRMLIEKCKQSVASGESVLFFAEGTRVFADGEPLGPFKPGAFIIAADTGATILPVTISGARKLFPPKGIPSLGFGTPVLTIHPPIQAAGRSVEELSAETRKVIASALREEDTAPMKSAPVANKKAD
jgi:1-acyl-sn-glycerol-3-phosphate acyltransferase